MKVTQVSALLACVLGGWILHQPCGLAQEVRSRGQHAPNDVRPAAVPQTKYLIEGVVVMLQDSLLVPLQSATVRLTGSGRGTLTNAEGRFTLGLELLPADLEITYIGYATTLITITDASVLLAVKLEPMAVPLKAVQITEHHTPENIIQETHSQALAHEQYRVPARGYFRQITLNDSVYSEFLEGFYEAWVSNNGLEALNLVQGRYADRPDSEERGYLRHANAIVLSETRRAYAEKAQLNGVLPISQSPNKAYEYALASAAPDALAGAPLEITFSPRSPYKLPLPRGRVFVEEGSHAIQKLVLENNDPRLTLHEGLSPEEEISNLRVRNEMGFVKRPLPGMADSVWVLDYIHLVLQFHYQRLEGEWPAADHQVRLETIFYCYDFPALSEEEAQRWGQPGHWRKANRYHVIDALGYDPQWWKDNPVLAYTQPEQEALEQLHAAGAFRHLGPLAPVARPLTTNTLWFRQP